MTEKSLSDLLPAGLKGQPYYSPVPERSAAPGWWSIHLKSPCKGVTKGCLPIGRTCYGGTLTKHGTEGVGITNSTYEQTGREESDPQILQIPADSGKEDNHESTRMNMNQKEFEPPRHEDTK